MVISYNKYKKRLHDLDKKLNHSKVKFSTNQLNLIQKEKDLLQEIIKDIEDDVKKAEKRTKRSIIDNIPKMITEFIDFSHSFLDTETYVALNNAKINFYKKLSDRKHE